ncbi:MAG: CBS domain-containing protein [Usitatibacter sp.]
MAEEDDRALSLAFMRDHPSQAAQVLEMLPAADAVAIFERAPARVGAGVLMAMIPQAAARCLGTLEEERAQQLLAHMGTLAAVSLLRHVPEEGRRALIAGLPAAAALASTLIMGYTEDTVGAWADPDVVLMGSESRVGDALERVRRTRSPHPEVFVSDAQRRLVGVVGVARLVQGADGASLASLMHAPAAMLPAHAPLAAARSFPGWDIASALPVVEVDDHLVGVITREALMRARRLDAVPEAPPASIPTIIARGYWQALAGLIQSGLGLLPTVPPVYEHTDER